MKKFLQTLLLIICLGVFCFSAWKLYGIWQEYQEGDEIYNSIQEQVILPSSEDEDTDTSDSSGLTVPDALVDLTKLKEINSDTVGWIQIPDTTINYPILQGKDNNQYLRRTITGEYNKAGCIFVDSSIENPFYEANTLVYGHNLLNGKMFSDLTEYEDKDWYLQHPYIYIQIEDGVLVYQLYSCYRTNDSSSTYTIGMENDTDIFQSYLDETLQHALYTTDITPDSSDKILTLSTCTNDEEDERFVVHALLITP